MGEECILAPVPVAHLPGVQAILDRGGDRVAFGSSDDGAEAWRHSAQSPIGHPVYVVASAAGADEVADPERYPVSAAVYGGVLERVVLLADHDAADPPLVLPEATVRIAALDAERDAWVAYWEVAGLRRLDPALPLDAFRTRGEERVAEVPRRPTLATRLG